MHAGHSQNETAGPDSGGSATAGAKLLGHPLHPMLTAFPIAFWIGAAFCDLVALLGADPRWTRIAAVTLAAGVATALPALATGLWDLVRLPKDHPAERLAWWHGGFMSTAFCLFLISLLLRRDVLTEATAPDTSLLAVALSVAGAAVTGVGGWLGGELVFGHGIGVRSAGDAETMTFERGDRP